MADKPGYGVNLSEAGAHHPGLFHAREIWPEFLLTSLGWLDRVENMFDRSGLPTPGPSMRPIIFLAAVLSLSSINSAVRSQSAGLGPTTNPVTVSDPVIDHHKAYAKTTYGISCPGDRVVWVNTNSGVYHLEGERWFGRTNSGKYDCEKSAKAEGDRETRNGQ